MPNVAPKELPPPPKLEAFLGRAVGSADDFWVLAYCHEADEIARQSQPQYGQSTFVLRYQLPGRTLVGRYPRRLDGLWQRSDGSLIAVGDTRGHVQITAAGITEVSLAPVPGIYSSIWGLDDDHVYAPGVEPPFIHYYHGGKWTLLSLPEGCAWINDVAALASDDVYFVGDQAQILHFDGKHMTRLKVPSRRHLMSVTRLDDKRLCVTGYQGTVLVGNRYGWRNQVSQVDDPLLAVATLGGRAYYGADSRVWSTDGVQPPQIAIDYPARWVSGLSNGLVLSNDDGAALYSAGNLIPLDVSL